MAKIFITGMAGFIGSHLADELFRQGHEVFGIDNLSTGKEENLSGLPKALLIRGDCNDQDLLKPFIKKCDVMFHLAASVGVKLFVEEPIEGIESNLKSTINVLNLADKYRKKIFIASSSEVYGKGDGSPLREEDILRLGAPNVTRWAYGCTKLLAEYLSLSYNKKSGLPVVVGRFFNICGPRQTGAYGMVIPRFVVSAIKGDSISVYGSGRQTRSFTYISDAVNAMLKLMHNKKAEGRVFNIGNPRFVTINQLAKLVKKTTKSNSPIVHAEYGSIYGKDFEDIYYRVPDISKIRRVVGFSPKIELEEMIMRIAAYWKEMIK